MRALVVASHAAQKTRPHLVNNRLVCSYTGDKPSSRPRIGRLRLTRWTGISNAFKELDTSMEAILSDRAKEMTDYEYHARESRGQAEELESLLRGLEIRHTSTSATPSTSHSTLSSLPSPFPLPSSLPNYKNLLRQTSPSDVPPLRKLRNVVPKLGGRVRNGATKPYKHDTEAFDKAIVCSRFRNQQRVPVSVGLSVDSMEASKTGWQGVDKVYAANLTKEEIERAKIQLVWFARANWIVSAELGKSLGGIDESPVSVLDSLILLSSTVNPCNQNQPRTLLCALFLRFSRVLRIAFSFPAHLGRSQVGASATSSSRE